MIFLFGFDLCFRFNTRNLWHYLCVHEISSGCFVPHFGIAFAIFTHTHTLTWLLSFWLCMDDKQHKCANRKCQQIKLKYIFLTSKTIFHNERALHSMLCCYSHSTDECKATEKPLFNSIHLQFPFPVTTVGL